MNDEALSESEYLMVQQQLQAISSVLALIDEAQLDRFINQIGRAEALGPILHPSAYRAGIDKLQEVKAHACALRTAQRTIKEARGV